MTWEEILAALDAVLAGTFDTPEAMAAEVAKVREQMAALLAEAASSEATPEEVSAAVEESVKAQAKLARIMTVIQQKKAVNEMKTKNASDLNALTTAAPVPSGFVVPEGAKITGAGRGIGRQIAKGAGERGAQVALVEVIKDNLDSAVAELSSLGITARGYLTDISDEAQINNNFAQIEKDFGRIDALVNNAMIHDPESKRFNLLWKRLIGL